MGDLHCIFEVSFLVFANHVNFETLVDVKEVIVNLLQHDIVLLERSKKYGFRVEKLLRYDARHSL